MAVWPPVNSWDLRKSRSSSRADGPSSRSAPMSSPIIRLTDASDWDDEMLRLELSDLVEGGFEIALTGITEDELSKLSVGVDELEQMPELPDGERSPFRDMT